MLLLLLLWKYNHSTIPCAGSSAASRVWLSIEGFWVDKGGHDKDKPNKYNASRVEMSLQFVAKNYVVVVSSLASLASDENLLYKHAMSNRSEGEANGNQS